MAGSLHQSSRVLWTVGLLLSLCMSLKPTAEARYRLLVLHTNDMHARFDQIDGTGAECTASSQTCYGGFARLKTAVNRERRHADVDGTLFLNAGDTFQGTPYYSYFKWRAVQRMVQMLGIDVMVSGTDGPLPMAIGVTRP